MGEWKKYKIGNICDRVCSGGTPKSTESAYYGGNIPWLNTKEINFNPIYETERYITQSGLDNSSAKWIDSDSVIVAMYGATAAKVAINKIPLTTNQACCNLSINKTIADYRYVYYYLCNNYSLLASLANGGAQQNLNVQQIKDFEISLPPLAEQKRIAAILGALDDKIELNRRINANLEEQARAIYEEWFVKNVKSKWPTGTLGDLIVIKYGKDHKKLNRGTIPVYGSGGIMRYADKYLYNKESVLIPRKGTLNNVQYLCVPFWSVDTMFYTEMRFQHIAKFIYFFLKSQNLVAMNAGSAVPSMTTEILNQLSLIIPDEKTLCAYDILVSSLFEQILHNREENGRLATLRDALLPKLISGDINI